MRKRVKNKTTLNKEQSSLNELLNLTEISNHEQLINSHLSNRPVAPSDSKIQITISFSSLVTYLES